MKYRKDILHLYLVRGVANLKLRLKFRRQLIALDFIWDSLALSSEYADGKHLCGPVVPAPDNHYFDADLVIGCAVRVP